MADITKKFYKSQFCEVLFYCAYSSNITNQQECRGQIPGHFLLFVMVLKLEYMVLIFTTAMLVLICPHNQAQSLLLSTAQGS